MQEQEPLLMSLAASMGFEPERSDHVYTMAAMVSLFEIGHVIHFAEAYIRSSMTVRCYVDVILTNSSHGCSHQ